MIQVDRKQFSRALDLASASVVSRATIPILGNLKVTANGKLRLEGTDLDNATCAEIPYTGNPGEFTLPQPRMVRAAINQAGADEVALELDENCKVQMRSGRLDSLLSTLPADDFPAAGRIGFEEFSATLGATELKQIKRVMSAISTEETRYYLNGVCINHVADWTYRFAATNGHALLMCDVPLPDAQGSIPEKTIIPREWLGIAMSRFLRAKEGARLSYGRMAVPNIQGPDLPLEPGGTRLSLRADLGGIDYSVTGKLIDGTYPDYMRVVPTEFTSSARFRRADLAQAVRALSSFSEGKKYRAVKLSFQPGKILCELHSAVFGKVAFDIEAEHSVSADFDCIGFNGNYLLDVLTALNGEEVVLQMADSAGPGLFTDPTDTAFKAVLMPMRV